jgi:hypothetical protein
VTGNEQTEIPHTPRQVTKSFHAPGQKTLTDDWVLGKLVFDIYWGLVAWNSGLGNKKVLT